MKQVCYNSFVKPNYDPERNTPMPTILPIQGTFDKAIPDNFGNAECRTEKCRISKGSRRGAGEMGKMLLHSWGGMDKLLAMRLIGGF